MDDASDNISVASDSISVISTGSTSSRSSRSSRSSARNRKSDLAENRVLNELPSVKNQKVDTPEKKSNLRTPLRRKASFNVGDSLNKRCRTEPKRRVSFCVSDQELKAKTAMKVKPVQPVLLRKSSDGSYESFRNKTPESTERPVRKRLSDRFKDSDSTVKSMSFTETPSSRSTRKRLVLCSLVIPPHFKEIGGY